MNDIFSLNDQGGVVAADRGHVWNHRSRHKPNETVNPQMIVEDRGMRVWDAMECEFLDPVSHGVQQHAVLKPRSDRHSRLFRRNNNCYLQRLLRDRRAQTDLRRGEPLTRSCRHSHGAADVLQHHFASLLADYDGGG